MYRKLLIFDMDGVLVNSEVYHTEACEELLREAAGKPVDTRAFHIPGIDTDELYRIGLEKGGCTGDPKLLSRLHFERTLELVRRNLPDPEPDLIRMLEDPRIRERTCYVASSSPRSFVEAVLDLYGIRGFFERVLTGDDVEHLKPAPDIYLLALSVSGLCAEEAVAVEDSRTGSLAAAAAGIACIGYRNPTSGEQDLSACFEQVDRLTQIPGLI